MSVPPHPDLVAGVRVESWRVERLSADDAPLGDLDGVVGGRLEDAVGAEIGGAGSLSVDVVGDELPWTVTRLRVWVRVGALEWAVGTYLPSVARTLHVDGGAERVEVSLLDKTAVLAEDLLAQALAIPAGAVATDAVRTVVEQAGETAAALTPSAETLVSGMTWPAGTSRLRVVNDLLAMINYFALSADGGGALRSGPYVEPSRREVVWDFAPGATAVHVPEVTREQDQYGVPNRVVLTTYGSGDTEGLVGVAEDTDPASPTSIPSRGRVVAHTESVEAATQAILDEIAARRLADLSSPAPRIEVEHAAVPLRAGDVVTIALGDRGPVRAVVARTSMDLGAGSLARTSLREVAGLP